VNEPGRRLPPERLFEALRELDVPNRHEGHPTLTPAISRAIRKRLERPRRASAALVGLALVACVALGMLGAWALVARGERSRDPAPVAHHGAGARKPHAALIRNASGTVVAAKDGKAFVVSSGEVHALTESSKVTTLVDSRAELELPAGVLVTVSQSTQLVVLTAGDREINLALALGRVAFEVPKLNGGRKVSVETPDATVVVRGTQFLVDVTPNGAATTTSVEVSRGSVLVLRQGAEVLLAAGESWSSATAPEPIDLDLGSGQAFAWSAPASPQHDARAETLTEENRLFQDALDARNAGDRRKAAKLLADLLARFPKSPLAHEACVERFRALEQAGEQAEAANEAKRYLQAYPRGSMATEARSLIEDARRSRQPRP
jgi:hypothetical protein